MGGIIMEQIAVMVIYADDSKEMRHFESMYYVGKWMSSLKWKNLSDVKFISVLGPVFKMEAK